MDRKGTDNERLTQLTNLLKDLQIQQQEITNEINTVTKLVNEIKNNKLKSTNNKEINKEKREKRRRIPLLGDTVTIINPMEGQPTIGQVAGFTKTDYIKVLGENGVVVRRIAKNLHIHK
jgi:hypothetical protein